MVYHMHNFKYNGEPSDDEFVVLKGLKKVPSFILYANNLYSITSLYEKEDLIKFSALHVNTDMNSQNNIHRVLGLCVTPLEYDLQSFRVLKITQPIKTVYDRGAIRLVYQVCLMRDSRQKFFYYMSIVEKKGIFNMMHSEVRLNDFHDFQEEYEKYMSVFRDLMVEVLL